MAAPAIILETVEYRAVVVVPQTHAVLAFDTVDGYRLPRVSIPRWTRPAHALQKAIETGWELKVLILDFLEEGDPPAPCVVAELLAPAAGFELNAIPPGEISDSDFSEAGRSRLVSLLEGESGGPFSRIGWIDEASRWIEATTGRRISTKADIEHFNAGGAFTLLRFPTEDGADCWMKATGAPNAHELPITSLLSRLCGDYLPEFITSRPDWNAWLMSGGGSPISELPADAVSLFTLLTNAVESIAELQIRTIGHEQILLRAGARDQGLDVLLAHSEALFAYLEETMQFEDSTKAPRIEKIQLRAIRGIFERACQRMIALELPKSVVHGDMSLANILLGGGHCQFIDWCETYVGNPLITFQHLLLLNQLSNSGLRDFVDRLLSDRYRTAMRKVCDPRAIDEGLIYAPLLAAASALYGRGDWLATSHRRESHRRAYARFVAQHMERASRRPALLSALRI